MELNMNSRNFKIAYLSVASLVAVCAIIAALLDQYYIAVGLIVLASIIIVTGAMYFASIVKAEKLRELKKM